MPAIVPGRVTADHAGEIVVFIIGMRVNKWFAVHKWLPTFRAMGAMLAELAQAPEAGFLAYEFAWSSPRQPVLIQYWRSFEALDGYANAKDRGHMPAWAAFNRAARGNDAVGIFHETYVVKPGCSESVYNDMPPFGLGKVAGVSPATGSRMVARGRMARS